MMKKTRKLKKLQRRPIEDVPFYKVEYKLDDLPLDPFRPFIKEEISMFIVVNFYLNKTFL